MGLFDKFNKKQTNTNHKKSNPKVEKIGTNPNEPFDMEVVKKFRADRKEAMAKYDDPNYKPEPINTSEDEIKINLTADEFEKILQRFDEIVAEENEKSRLRNIELQKWHMYIKKNNDEAIQYLYAGNIEKATELFEKNISALDITTISYSYLVEIYRLNEDYPNELRICDCAIESLSGSPHRKNYIPRRAEVIKRINNEGTFSDDGELYEIIKQEEKFLIKHHLIKDYYKSEQYDAERKSIKEAKDKYLENITINSPSLIMMGTTVYPKNWSELYKQSKEMLELLACCGGGKYLENKENYKDALVMYEKGRLIAEKLYPHKEQTAVDKRIEICNNKIKKQEIKELEQKAKELEKTNPQEAIELYNKLNVLNPNLKKYDKRIEILTKKI